MKRTFNVEFQHSDKQEGLVFDETQFDIEDGEFGEMYCELSNLFEAFCVENKWDEWWISNIYEVPYDGEEE